MRHDLICGWLGLSPEEGWPPDHYRLLGLEPGENDTGRIEERVHQRLDAVRRYQMMNPELATEAMNRLAQAFVCLTEPATKRAYDDSLGIVRPSPPPVEAVTPSPVPRPAAPVRNGNATPPPLPAPVTASPPPLPHDWPTAPLAPLGAVELPPEEPATPAPAPEPEPELIDSVVAAAVHAPHARRGLGTKRALYHRIARTRELLRLWRRIGKTLSDPARRLSKAEAGELGRLLADVQDVLDGFPPLMGEAGQPGYLVIALAQVDVRPTVLSLALSQREALARDWHTGHKFLRAHRDFLRQEIRAMRRRGLRDRLVRAVRSFLHDRPGVAVLLLLALVALNIALWRTYAHH